MSSSLAKRQTTGWSNALPDSQKTIHAPKKPHWLYYWLPAFIGIGVIASFSSGEFSADNTGSVLEKLIRAFHISLTGLQFYWLHVAIRKSAHFTVYGILSALFFRAWRGQPSERRWKWTWALLGILAAFLIASGDEFHQHFTPGRTGVFSDVELDTMGATFAQLMIVVWTPRNRWVRR